VAEASSVIQRMQKDKLPRIPRMHSRMVVAFVSMTDSITSAPPFRHLEWDDGKFSVRRPEWS